MQVCTYSCGMTETRWWRYLQRLMGDHSQLQAAQHIGISKSNITRWKDGARAAPDFVVKVARAYGANVLEALVEAEFITEEEASLREVSPRIDLRKATNQQILDEVMRRSDPEGLELFQNSGITPRTEAPTPNQSPYAVPDYLGLVADSDNEPLGDDHDYIP